MDSELIQKLEPQYRDLQHHIDLLSEDKCKITDVKKRSALLGIYREKDGTYMCRVRRNSGRIALKNLHDLAAIMDAHQIDHAHFSTRQNIQLHGVPAEQVHATIHACNAADMLFRGGGGNTFRSIITSPRSGTSPTELFDTVPHTEAIWNWAGTYERAYGFGRKFKVGISSEPTDDINAGIQDLGFVAQLQKGEHGFKVYCGGGMGRDPGLGMVISHFIPEKEIIRYVQAAIDLFFEHGNRKVRPKARLRFVLQEIGPEAFRHLFFQYLEEADAPDCHPLPIDYSRQLHKPEAGPTPPPNGFEEWQQRSVQPTSCGEEIKAAKLYVRHGNVNSVELKKLAVLLDKTGIHEIRATSTQDILIPLIHTSALPGLFSELKNNLSTVINVAGSFSGQIISCIGATACPIGLLQTEKVRERIAQAMNALSRTFPDLDPAAYESIIAGIHISGCASSCGLNQVAAIGLHGHKKRVAGEVAEFFQLHLGGLIHEKGHNLGCTGEQWLIPVDEVAPAVSALVQVYLQQAPESQSLTEFMASKRPSLESLAEFSISQVVQILEN